METASPAGQQNELEKDIKSGAVKGGTEFVEFELKKRDFLWRERACYEMPNSPKGRCGLRRVTTEEYSYSLKNRSKVLRLSIQCEALMSHAQHTRCKNFLRRTLIAVQTSTSADSSCRLNTVFPFLSIEPGWLGLKQAVAAIVCERVCGEISQRPWRNWRRGGPD